VIPALGSNSECLGTPLPFLCRQTKLKGAAFDDEHIEIDFVKGVLLVPTDRPDNLLLVLKLQMD